MIKKTAILLFLPPLFTYLATGLLYFSALGSPVEQCLFLVFGALGFLCSLGCLAWGIWLFFKGSPIFAMVCIVLAISDFFIPILGIIAGQ